MKYDLLRNSIYVKNISTLLIDTVYMLKHGPNPIRSQYMSVERASYILQAISAVLLTGIKNCKHTSTNLNAIIDIKKSWLPRKSTKEINVEGERL